MALQNFYLQWKNYRTIEEKNYVSMGKNYGIYREEWTFDLRIKKDNKRFQRCSLKMFYWHFNHAYCMDS